jgi:hypothetical protein
MAVDLWVIFRLVGAASIRALHTPSTNISAQYSDA